LKQQFDFNAGSIELNPQEIVSGTVEPDFQRLLFATRRKAETGDEYF
jgi:hypothetical protein